MTAKIYSKMNISTKNCWTLKAIGEINFKFSLDKLTLKVLHFIAHLKIEIQIAILNI